MIEMKNAQKEYPGFKLDVSLEIPENTITGLVGVNGSGKTTTFRILLGLEKADKGTARILNENAWNITPATKEKIGIVFSDSGFSGYLNIQAVKNIEKAFYSNFDEELFLKLCGKYGLDLKKRVSQLSTGLNARLKLIAAISHKPELLILDEPTAGLDILARQDLLSLLQEYMEVPGRSILISSHIASDLESICDDLYMIKEGKIVLHSDMDSLINEYGILKLTDKQAETLDLRGVIKKTKTPNGYDILVKDRKYYQENYPELILDKGNIDEIIRIEEGRQYERTL